jgi:hypothetical protein
MYWWYKNQDPFQVCNSHRYFATTRIAFNRDYISTQTFLQRCDTTAYDAFIFGSSRCYAFAPSIWRDFVPNVQHPFTFDASQETIRGIRQKLELISKKGLKPKEVLLVFCKDATFCQETESESYLFAKHPALSGKSDINFQIKFFKAFYSPQFLLKYINYSMTDVWTPNMKGYIQQYQVSLDSNTNEVISEAYDKSFSEESVFDGKPHIAMSDAPQIDSRDLEDLQIIKKLLDEMGANYHIILSPLYAQIPFHPNDSSILHQLFPQRVHDYSHRTDITTDSRNYYEKSHYNKRIGSYLLSEIYSNYE